MSLPGIKDWLHGESGSGKTHAIRTLLRTKVQPLVLFTEAGMRSLAPCDNAACLICKDTRNAPLIPWTYVPGAPGDVDTQIEAAILINTRDQAFLSGMRDNNRKAYSQFVDVLKAIKNFTDSTGKSWGGVHSWNTDRCLVLDGWSGLGPMALNLFCGKRPNYDKPDYGIAQKALFNLWQMLALQLRCHVIVIGHTERGLTESGVSMKLTINTIGRALAPDLPKDADDFIYSDRVDGKNFKWSTASPTVVTKTRNLPLSDNLPPDFAPVIASWERAGGIIVPTGETK